MSYTINGKLVDKYSKEGVPFANIFLISDPTKGTTTGYDGNFTFEVPNIDSMVGISQIQYRNIQLSAGDLNYKTTRLDPQSQQVGEVEVKAKKWLPYVLYGGSGLLLVLGYVKNNKKLLLGGLALALSYPSYKMYMKYRYKRDKE